MKRAKNNPGFTLMEMMVVMGIMMLFAAMAMPAFTKLMEGNKTGAAKNMIQSLMAVAQAHAAKNQVYAGIRFQFDSKGWQTGTQHMVLIEAVTSGPTILFQAVPNTKPYALPLGIAVITQSVDNFGNFDLDDEDYSRDNNGNGGMNDSVTFSILFSPTGQLVIKRLSVRPNQYNIATGLFDPIFSHPGRVNLPSYDLQKSMFYCDGFVWAGFDCAPFGGSYNPPLWCYPEPSATGFYICEAETLRQTNAGMRYSDYVSQLTPHLINSYTGAMIDMEEFQ